MTTVLELTCHDPLVARDSRPFGIGQGTRMRSLSWPLPSVVAGSLRTALVKAHPALDFSGEMPQRLQRIEVAGVFPVVAGRLSLPAPSDCVWDDATGRVRRAQPTPLAEGEGVDFPMHGLNPVQLTKEQAEEDFKAKPAPAWWPLEKYAAWLIEPALDRAADWFDGSFLAQAAREVREHVSLDPATGAALEGRLFATTGLALTHLPRFGASRTGRFHERFAEATLTVRMTSIDPQFAHAAQLDIWHPLGGERRVVHWRARSMDDMWTCPDAVKTGLKGATHLRMVLATPALFRDGWKPGWLNDHGEGSPPGSAVTVRLVGVSIQRWQAVSGWSLGSLPGQPRGSKPIRRLVPAGGVYFFELVAGNPENLASQWLHPVSDDEQERRDGFGLALWGLWHP